MVRTTTIIGIAVLMLVFLTHMVVGVYNHHSRMMAKVLSVSPVICEYNSAWTIQCLKAGEL